MAAKTTAPYGRWTSPISAEAATAGSRSLSSPRSASGRAFFLASKPDGSSTIYEVGPRPADPPHEVLPEPWGVGTTVYEYGGQAYALLPSGSSGGDGGDSEHLRIVFGDPRDNSVNLLDVDAQKVTTLVPGQPHLRYGDFAAHPGGSDRHPWVLVVQEDHARPRPAEVRNYVVAVNTETGAVVRVVEGADFYSYPRFQPDSNHTSSSTYRISWRQWDHPDLPFDGVELHWASWSPSSADTALQDRTFVAGRDRQNVAEPTWSPDGVRLVFGMEATGTDGRQLFTVSPEDKNATDGLPKLNALALKGLEDVEFGDASWWIGCQTIVFLTPSTVVAKYTRLGQNHLVYVNLDTGAWVSLDADVGLVETPFDGLAALSESSFLAVGSGFTAPQAVYRVDLDLEAVHRLLAAGHLTATGSGSPPLATATPLFRSTDQEFPPEIFSRPDRIAFPGWEETQPGGSSRGEDDDTTVYAWFWPPHNQSFEAPTGTLPPLIVTPHGGPTGYTPPGLHMIAQFWATRGFAYCAVNYSGSSAHGRRYRDRLWTRWGLLDRDDVAAAVLYLGEKTGRVDPQRVGIEGASAGGYNVLQSLVWHSQVFAGGICCCGVADTAALAADTHKLESRYLDWLLWDHRAPPPTEEQERIHGERSPLFHAERIRAPLLLIHGDEDAVVPIQQSESIRDRIRQRPGGATEDDVDLVVLPGEGHMFKKSESQVRYLAAEEAWWSKTLLK